MSFQHPLRVRFNECDPAGVVFNAHYPMYLDVAYIEMLRAAIGGIEQMWSEHGVGMLVGHYAFDLRRSLRADDEFTVELTIEKIGTTSMTTAATFRRGDEVVTTATIRHVCVELDGYAKTAVPDGLRARLLETAGA